MDLKTVRQRVAERKYKDARGYLADIAKIASYATNTKKASHRERFEAYQMVRTFFDEIQSRGMMKPPTVVSRPPSTVPMIVKAEALVGDDPVDADAAAAATVVDIEKRSDPSTKLGDMLDQYVRKGVLKPGCRLQLHEEDIALLAESGTFVSATGHDFPSAGDISKLELANCNDDNMWDGMTVDSFNVRKLKWLAAKLPELGAIPVGQIAGDEGKTAAKRKAGVGETHSLPLAVRAAAIAPLDTTRTVKQSPLDTTTVKQCERIGYHTYDDSVNSQLADACFACGCGFTEVAAPVRCRVCCEAHHAFCVDSPVDDLKNWVCGHCRACAVCSKGCHGQRIDVLECDQCAKLVHRKCLRMRPSAEATRQRWLCEECVECDSCGRKTAGDTFGCQWAHDYTLCEECGILRDKGNFCPMCNVLYHDDDFETKMMCCDTCDKWLHISCVNIDDETYERLSTSCQELPFECPRCNPHGNVTHTLLNQIAHESEQSAQDALYINLQKVFQAARRVSVAWAFKYAADRTACPDYDEIVSQEIHFPYIEQQLANRKYADLEAFTADVEKMIDNCLLYYGPDHNAYTKDAELFRGVFAKKLAKVFSPEPDKATDAGAGEAQPQPAPVDGESTTPGVAQNMPEAPSDTGELGRAETAMDVCAPTTTICIDESMCAPAGSLSQSRHGTAAHANAPLAGAATVDAGASETMGVQIAIPHDPVGAQGTHQLEEAAAAVTAPLSPTAQTFLDAEAVVPMSPRVEKVATREYLEKLWSQPRVDHRACSFCARVGDFPDGEGGRLVPVQPTRTPKATPEVTVWVHANCALWSAEVYELESGEIMEVHPALRRAKLLKCTVCNLSGATVGCCFRNCKGNYHFACARKCGATFTRSSEVYCVTCHPKVKHLEPEHVLSDSDFICTKMSFIAVDPNPRLDRKKKDKIEQETPPPIRIGCLAVHQYGVLQPQWPNFATETKLLPVGYLASRTFWSHDDPTALTRYFLSIGRRGAFPTFEICTAAGFVVKESTLEAAWAGVIAALKEKGWTEKPPVTVDGYSMFGLTCPPVVAALERLSFATSCKGYHFRFRDPLKDAGPRINLSGCARTEPFSKIQLASQLALDAKKKKGPSQAGSRAPRPTNSMQQMASSMQYRQAKKVLKDTITVKHSKIQGWGLFARRRIPKNDMVSVVRTNSRVCYVV